MLYIWELDVWVNWMMVLGSSGERLDIASSCLAARRRLGFRMFALQVRMIPDGVDATFQPGQRVEAAFLIAGKEAIAVEEVGPGHFDGLKRVGAVLPQRLARAAARLDHLVVPAGRREHRAAHQTYLRGALPIEQAVDDAQEQVLCPRLGLQTTLVAKDVWEYGSGEATHRDWMSEQ